MMIDRGSGKEEAGGGDGRRERLLELGNSEKTLMPADGVTGCHSRRINASTSDITTY